MSLEQVVHRVEARLYALGKRLFREDPLAELREEIAQLDAELHRRYDQLSERRRTITEMRRRIAAGEIRAALLGSQVDTCTLTGDRAGAYQHALELEQIRKTLVREREELPYLERARRTEQAEVARLEEDLLRLRRRFAQEPKA